MGWIAGCCSFGGVRQVWTSTIVIGHLRACAQLALHSEPDIGCLSRPGTPGVNILYGVPRSYEYKHPCLTNMAHEVPRSTYLSAHHLYTAQKSKKEQTHLHASTPSLTPHGLHLPFALAPPQLPQRARASTPKPHGPSVRLIKGPRLTPPFHPSSSGDPRIVPLRKGGKQVRVCHPFGSSVATLCVCEGGSPRAPVLCPRNVWLRSDGGRW